MSKININKKSFLFLLLILSITGFFGFWNNSLASEKDLIITEIMYNPAKNEAGDKVEWIEMYAKSDKNFSLKSNKQIDGFYLCAKKGDDENSCKNSYVSYSLTDTLEIKKGIFLIFTKDPEIFKDYYGNLDDTIIIKTSSSFNLLGNENAFIAYSEDNKSTWFENIDCSNFFDKKDEGYSLEKINFSGDNSEENWQESYEFGGTPGKESSKRKTYPKKIWINEILPNPEGDDTKEEFIELFNSEDKDVNLTNWSLEDSGGHKFTFSKKYCEADKNKCLIESDKFLVIKSENYSSKNLSLNNSNGDTLFLFDPNNDEISRVSYSSANEAVSYNFDSANWRWSRHLTPGEENKFNNLPDSKIKEDKNIYVGMYADFSARASDRDKDKLKFIWDFGDGHKSYLKKTRHKYEKAGKYTVTLKIFDGSEEKIETFNIEVKKFLKAKVKITSLSPNPSGKDSDFEWIEIENKAKKKINLKGWSVATGSKNLYNHPITEDFVIEKGESGKLTRDFCKFTLNNKKNKIELRYPDGKVADKVKYKKEGRSVEEDEIYKKTQDGWRWLESQNNTENIQNNTEELLNNAEVIQNNEEETDKEDFSEFIGGWSEDESDKISREELLNYGTQVKLAAAVYSGEGKVLGVSTENYNEPVYRFSENAPGEHYAIKFFKNILSAINYLINKMISSFY